MAGWTLELTDEAKADLATLDATERRRMLEKVVWLAEHFDEVTPVALGGEWRAFSKLRAGDWRAAYTVAYDERTITVHMIDRRDKIYKRSPPTLP